MRTEHSGVTSICDIVSLCVACRSETTVNAFSPLGEERYLCARCLEEIRGLREDRLLRRSRRKARRRAWAELRLALGAAFAALRRVVFAGREGSRNA